MQLRRLEKLGLPERSRRDSRCHLSNPCCGFFRLWATKYYITTLPATIKAPSCAYNWSYSSSDRHHWSSYNWYSLYLITGISYSTSETVVDAGQVEQERRVPFPPIAASVLIVTGGVLTVLGFRRDGNNHD